MTEKFLGDYPKLCDGVRVPMTDSSLHLRSQAGASFTKAVAMLCRGQMRPVSIYWNKHQVDQGSQA